MNYGDIGPKVAAYSVGRMLRQQEGMVVGAAGGGAGAANVSQRISPAQLACRYCGAKPGAQCTRWRRTKRGKVKQNRDSPHPDRKYDAKIANQALDAMKPQKLVFRSR